MKRSRFSEEQIIGILKEHQAGLSATDLYRKHGISDAAFYKWRSKSGGLEASDVVKALKQAVRNRITTYPLIHHSDRGLQYCSGLYQSVLKENNITASMTDAMTVIRSLW